MDNWLFVFVTFNNVFSTYSTPRELMFNVWDSFFNKDLFSSSLDKCSSFLTNSISQPVNCNKKYTTPCNRKQCGIRFSNSEFFSLEKYLIIFKNIFISSYIILKNHRHSEFCSWTYYTGLNKFKKNSNLLRHEQFELPKCSSNMYR